MKFYKTCTFNKISPYLFLFLIACSAKASKPESPKFDLNSIILDSISQTETEFLRDSLLKIETRYISQNQTINNTLEFIENIGKDLPSNEVEKLRAFFIMDIMNEPEKWKYHTNDNPPVLFQNCINNLNKNFSNSKYAKILAETLETYLFNNQIYLTNENYNWPIHAIINGTDVLLRESYTTQSKILGSFKNKGERVRFLYSQVSKQNSAAILNNDVIVNSNEKSYHLLKGKAIRINSVSEDSADITFNFKHLTDISTKIDMQSIEDINTKVWYKVLRSDGQKGWVLSKYVIYLGVNKDHS